MGRLRRFYAGLQVLTLMKEATMRVRFLTCRVTTMLGAASLTMLFVATPGLRAEQAPHASRSVPDGLATVKIVDVLNLFSNVGALIYFAEPNDFGIPPGIATHCSGTLIHERVFLLAGHCTAPTAGGLLPFVKAFVTFSPNALDRSTWLPVSSFAFHPSLPPCPPPEGCTFQGLDPGILDVGLVFLSRPVRHIAPARLAKPGTLETAGAAGKLMIVAGYGHLDSLPGGGPPPDSEWDGLRRIEDLEVGDGRRQRMGKLVYPGNRVLWRFRSADLLRCSCRGGGKRRRRLLRTRLSGTCRYDGRAGLDTPDDRGRARSAEVTVDRKRWRCVDPLYFVAGSTPFRVAGLAGSVFQAELLHSPVHELGDVQGVGIAAVDFVDHAELLELLAGAADTAEHGAVQLHLVDLAVEERVLGRVGVGAVEKLLRAGRDADGTRRAHVLDLALERAVVVEHLNPLIAHVGDVDVAAGIDGDGVGSIELALFGPGRPPGLDELPGLVELGDAGVAVTVRDENVAGSVPGHIGGLVEIVAADTRARRP